MYHVFNIVSKYKYKIKTIKIFHNIVLLLGNYEGHILDIYDIPFNILLVITPLLLLLIL